MYGYYLYTSYLATVQVVSTYLHTRHNFIACTYNVIPTYIPNIGTYPPIYTIDMCIIVLHWVPTSQVVSGV